MNNNKIGKFIAKCRKAKNLTQQQLGDKLFVTDKAVSKWERGLSLPDITIIEKLAIELDTDIYSILQIQKKSDIEVATILNTERLKIKKQLIKKIQLLLIPIVLMILIVLFKLLPFGYNVIHPEYEHSRNKIVNLGIPKFSFFMKNNGDSYYFKNLRGKNILKSEMKSFLNTLEHISCNNTTYYYDSSANITIVDYNVEGNLLYNNISYSIKKGNYCDTIQVSEYKEKIGMLNTMRTLYTEKSDLTIYFIPSLKISDGENKWIADLKIYYHNGNENKILEKSSGTFEIKNNELIYYRTKIEKNGNLLDIPNVSYFVIKEKKLILKENYLKDYEKSITLK